MDSITEFKKLCKADKHYACGFIGAGNMAFAIVSGLIKSNIFEGAEIIISATRDETFKRWKSLGVHTTLDNKELVQTCRIIFLCVKPHIASVVAQNLGCIQTSGRQTLVSILAGTSLESLNHTFKNLPDVSFIRAMPNTPLMVCAGATAITQDDVKSKESQLNFNVIKLIFGTLGVVEVVDESMFHAITGVSGSGPAYIYIMIEALSDAGVKQGLPRDLATKFAAQTVYGASKTLLETGLHPGQAKDQVTSAGGTTIYAIHELEKGRLRDTIINAVEAATNRSMELAKK